MIDPVQQILSSLSVIFLLPTLSVSDLVWRLLVGLHFLMVLVVLVVVSLTEVVVEVLEVIEVEILMIHLPHDSRLNNRVTTPHLSTNVICVLPLLVLRGSSTSLSGTGLYTAGQVDGVEVMGGLRDIETVRQTVLVPQLSAGIEQPHILNITLLSSAAATQSLNPP